MGQLSINRPGGFSRAVNATLVSYTRIRRATGINEDELRSRHKVVVLFHRNNTLLNFNFKKTLETQHLTIQSVAVTWFLPCETDQQIFC